MGCGIFLVSDDQDVVIGTADGGVVADVLEADALDRADVLSFVDVSSLPDVTVNGCVDNDFDGYGLNCAAGEDCDDTDATVYRELMVYEDQDLDERTPRRAVSRCVGAVLPATLKEGQSAENDCDDTNNNRYEGNQETCDGLDNDCNLSADDNLVCGCEARYFGDDRLSPYLFCFQEQSYDDSLNECNSKQGYKIVTFESAEEVLMVQQEVDSIASATWFIGLTDRGDEGVYVWETGETLTLGAENDGFREGEPNNGFDGNEDCVIIEQQGWDDRPCGSNHATICERAQ